MLFLAGLLTVALASCTTLRSQLVATGTPGTHHLAVSPFWISTNFPLSEHDPLVQELVSLREQVLVTLRLSRPTREIEIYIFDDRPSYQRFLQKHYPELPPRRAFFIAQAEREVVYSFRGGRLNEDLRHEACHALVHAAIQDVPLWLDEGLAEFFENPAEMGGFHQRHLAALRVAIGRGWRPGLTRLESFTQVNQMTSEDYGEAWAWVYFMLRGSLDGHNLLVTYLADLSRQKPAEPFSARIFRTIPHADAALVSYLSRLDSDSAAAAVSRSATRSAAHHRQ